MWQECGKSITLYLVLNISDNFLSTFLVVGGRIIIMKKIPSMKLPIIKNGNSSKTKHSLCFKVQKNNEVK